MVRGSACGDIDEPWPQPPDDAVRGAADGDGVEFQPVGALGVVPLGWFRQSRPMRAART